jgi:hypothetical protein
MPSERIGDDDEIMFDLEKDPGELHNLVFDKSYLAKLSELRVVLATGMELRGMRRFESKE